MSLSKAGWNKSFKSGKDYTPLNRLFLADLLEHLGINETGKTVLDLGCGSGDALREFARAGFSGRGFDFSPEALRLAEERTSEAELANKLSFAELDLNQLSAQNIEGEYDIVFSKLVYAFIEDKQQFLREVKGLTDRSDGTFVLMTPVLYPNIEYSNFLNTISVPYQPTVDLLHEVFDEVEIFHTGYFRKQGVRMTFIAS